MSDFIFDIILYTEIVPIHPIICILKAVIFNCSSVPFFRVYSNYIKFIVQQQMITNHIKYREYIPVRLIYFNSLEQLSALIKVYDSYIITLEVADPPSSPNHFIDPNVYDISIFPMFLTFLSTIFRTFLMCFFSLLFRELNL